MSIYFVYTYIYTNGYKSNFIVRIQSFLFMYTYEYMSIYFVYTYIYTSVYIYSCFNFSSNVFNLFSNST